VTKQAYAMVSIYGLNERIGNRSYYDSRGDQMFTKPYSEETSRIIDEEVGKIIDGAYHRAKEILQSNFDKLSALADSLLTNEVIFREDVERILGARPFQKPAPALPIPEAPAAPEASSPAEEDSEDAPESSEE
jgi:cell division protease FtsH